MLKLPYILLFASLFILNTTYAQDAQTQPKTWKAGVAKVKSGLLDE